MMRSLWAVLVLVGWLSGCSPSGEPAPEPTSNGEAEAPTNRIDIPPTVRSNLGMTFAQVEARRVAQTIRVPGAFELMPRARREYRLALPGRVELLVDQYSPVEPGQALYRYQSPAWVELVHEIVAAEQDIDLARADIEVAKASREEARTGLLQVQKRLEALARADFKKADLELEAASYEARLPRLEAEIRRAETRRESASRIRGHALHRAATALGMSEEELRSEVAVDGRTIPRYQAIDWIEVRAKEAGIVEKLSVTDGAFLEATAAVLSTVDPTQVRFRARALQSDLAKLSAAEEAIIVPPESPGTDRAAGVPAAIELGLEAQPEERTLTLLARPEHLEPWIRPGVSAFVEVVTDATAGPALAIPQAAIVQDGIQHVFFRRDPTDPNKAIRVEADLGVSDGRWTVVQSGVARGDEVVVDGAYELQLASERTGVSQQGGHFHADGSYHGDH